MNRIYCKARNRQMTDAWTVWLRLADQPSVCVGQIVLTSTPSYDGSEHHMFTLSGFRRVPGYMKNHDPERWRDGGKLVSISIPAREKPIVRVAYGGYKYLDYLPHNALIRARKSIASELAAEWLAEYPTITSESLADLLGVPYDPLLDDDYDDDLDLSGLEDDELGVDDDLWGVLQEKMRLA